MYRTPSSQARGDRQQWWEEGSCQVGGIDDSYQVGREVETFTRREEGSCQVGRDRRQLSGGKRGGNIYQVGRGKLSGGEGETTAIRWEERWTHLPGGSGRGMKLLSSRKRSYSTCLQYIRRTEGW